MGEGNVGEQSGPPLGLSQTRGKKRRGGLAKWRRVQKTPEPPGAAEGFGDRRDALALVPGLSGRGFLSLPAPGLWLPPISFYHGSRSWICHIPQRPKLPSCWAWKSPQGQAGLRAGKTGPPRPPPQSAWSSGRGCQQELEVPYIPHRMGMGGEWGRRESRGSTWKEEVGPEQLSGSFSGQ